LDLVLARKLPEEGEEDARLSRDHAMGHGDDGETTTIQGHVASLSDANHYVTVEQAAADADAGFQTLTLTGRGSQQDLYYSSSRLPTDGQQPLTAEPAEHDQPDRRSSPRTGRQQSDPASKAPPKNQLQLPNLRVNQGTSTTAM